MKGFTPFKRHANEFKYTPRFYNPAKEERDQRRAELRGSRPEGQVEGDYVVGEYLHRQREARLARGNRKGGAKNSMWFMVIAVALIFLMAYMLLPRLIEAFMVGTTQTEKVEPLDEFEEFDPYAPLKIIPND